jgi:alanyl-tRNA synthetase
LATLLNVAPPDVNARVEKLLAQVKSTNDELNAARRREALAGAQELAAGADNGVVVTRRDGVALDDLRQLAMAARDVLGATALVMLLGLNDAKAGVVVALGKERVARGSSAAELAAPVAKLLGGGTAKNAELVVGGGPNVAAIDDALEVAREQATRAVG